MSPSRRTAIVVSLIAIAGAILVMSKFYGSDHTLRVAFPVARPAISYEPTNINLDFEYIFLENVFSPLVEIDPQGEIKHGISKKAEWFGDELHLTIRDGLKTENGTPITADDVIFSLKRLLVLTGNTHGNFKDLVCPTVELKTVEDDCPELRREGNTVIIVAKERKSFLLPMLAAIDFAIIPRSSTDPKTLKIINFKETSGPYYVSADDGKGHIELKLNRSHYHAADNIPQVVKLVPSDSTTRDSSLTDLLENRVDHVMTVDMAKADDLFKFSANHPEFGLHTTQKIRKILLVFTERGQKELSAGERRYIAKRIRSAFKDIYNGVISHDQTDEFFSSLGDGGLSEDEQKKVIALHNTDGAKPHTRIKLGLIRKGDLGPWADPIHKYLPEADCYAENNVPDFKTYATPDDMPHAFIAGTDAAFMEDINLISYTINAGLLGLSKPEREKWLAGYMAIEEKKARMTKLRALQFKALSETDVVPLIAAPYTALIRKPWQMELSNLYANNPLWLIKLK